MTSVHVPWEALVTERVQESPTVLTLRLCYTEGESASCSTTVTRSTCG